MRLGAVDARAFGGRARDRDGGHGVGVRKDDADVRGDGGAGDWGGDAMGGLVWEGDESAGVCAGGGRGGVFDEGVRDDDGCVLSVDMREKEWVRSGGVVCGVSVFGSVDAGGVSRVCKSVVARVVVVVVRIRRFRLDWMRESQTPFGRLQL